nr:zinc finger, CCHC-type [Tanacetum cinerariifolium]
MAIMNTKLNIEKLNGNNVQKHRGSKQVGLKQLGSKQVGFKQLGVKQVGFKQLGLNVETGVHEVSNDDTAVAQRRLEDKQPEEKTNTDCLVKEQEKEYQTGWKIKTGPNGGSGGKLKGRFGEHCGGNAGIGGFMSGVGEGKDEMRGGSLARCSMVSNDGREVED